MFDRAAFRARLSAALTAEAEFGTPFLMVPVLLLAGVTLYFSLPTEPARHNIALGLGVFAVAWRLARDRSRMLARAILAVLVTLAGMGIAQWHTLARDTQMLGSEVTTTLTGRIVRIEPRPNGSARYTLDVLKTERPLLRFAPDRLRVTARTAVEDARVGDGLHGLARLRPASGPVRPGGYDFAFHGYFAGHGANGFFYGPPDRIDLAPRSSIPAQLDTGLQNARLWLAQRIMAAAPGEAGIVSAALVTGHRSAIPEHVNEALRISGLAHILSISGLHMALVAGTVMIALRAGFATSGGFTSGHATKKYAAAVGFAAILIYLFLAGASVATQRSFIMLAVMLGALMMDRAAISKRNLAIAAIIVIAIAPNAAIGPSFHMSFAATLALIALYDIWNRARAERFRRFGAPARVTGAAALPGWTVRFMIGVTATSIIAGAASGLYAAYHFHRVAPLGLFTNLGAMPIVSLLTMPLAILATVTIPFGIDGYLYWLMAESARWILAIAHWITAHSPPGMVGAMSDAAMVAATIALIWLCICRTWLRWGAALPALLAVWLMADRPLPLVVISEDARQMALIDADGSLAVNRSRPSRFILDQWQSAYAAPMIIKPVGPQTPAGEGAAPVMVCDDDLCTGRVTRDGTTYRVAIAASAGVIDADACGYNDLIVLAHAPAQSPCDGAGPLVLTAQDLALKGSAEIIPMRRPMPDGRKTKPALVARHAVTTPFRPWHDHRQWSRSARNLASRNQ